MTHASFEQQIQGLNFVFARVCSDEDNCNHYSVMNDAHILRMTRQENEDNYTIPDKNHLPEEIIQLESQLSSAIVEYEKQETLVSSQNGELH
ncbi:MAG TPA: hypothetical protein PL009_11290 [Flavipsychrobacter sp.]|nr:hypothetical protein [Flavipsychrobacter sp.]